MTPRPEPDRHALEMAHFLLRLTVPLDEALRHPPFCRILKNVARQHMKRRARFDPKLMQANDAEVD